jgi:thymidylate synthase
MSAIRGHEYESFAAAYLAELRSLLAHGRQVAGVREETSVGSSFGQGPRATLELGPHLFTIGDPRACLLVGGAREPREAYVVGQWLWVMAGTDRLEQISYYNSHGRAFSDDGRRLTGAFGTRMRVRGGDQLQRVIGLLSGDPSSRRAQIVFAEPGDGREPSRDFPCATAIQFVIRDDRLEAVTTMRSQSALMVLPYDISLMATLQVWVAAVLRIAPGPHHWIANSFHVYADEIELAKEVLADPPEPVSLPPAGSDPERRLTALQSYERTLRDVVIAGEAGVSEIEAPSCLQDDEELHGHFAALLRRYAIGREREATKSQTRA